MDTKFTNWAHEEGSTLNPLSSVEELVEELPSMTAAAVVGVVLVVLLAIGLVFTLGVMLDCRQKKVLERRVRHLKPRRRTGAAAGVVDVESEGANIAEHMEPSATSPAPAPAATAPTLALHTP